jgi:ATP-dependent Clp protease ATP-binding subunit ClpC
MRKPKRDDPATSHPHAVEDAEAAARAAARSIAERLQTEWPEFERLGDDPEFVRASARLAAPDVSLETVERLGRASKPILAAIAHRATALRAEVSADWLDWAYRRMKGTYAGELAFLLEAVERHGQPPFIARVLARCDDNWHEGWLLDVVTAFAARRVAAGEIPTVAEFEAFVDEPQVGLVAAVVAELEGTLPRETVRDFEQWRRGRERLEFFGSFGRIWDAPRDVPALTAVGGRAAVVAALQAALRDAVPRSALVVGEHGVGKSAVVREALRPFQDEGWLVFEAGAADVNAGQVHIGQLEGRLHEIVEHAAGSPTVWVLPAFEDTLWAGQHLRSPRGLLDAMLPYVAAGQLVVVGEVEPKAYELLVQHRPRAASLFEALRLDPLSPEEAMSVAADWRDRVGADIDDATIEDTQELAQHYLPAVAAPAGLLRLLKATLAGAVRTGGGRVRAEQVLETLSEATGLPLHVVDPETPLDLEEVRSFFSTRVLGQPEAVDCLVDRIALIKAHLTDPTRPFGVFLFVGPTGTGKTEIAKALAEFLFGSPDRLVRLDMSEFQTEHAFERLLADSSSHDEAATLISSVRAKPFSVVLLDEFEKAHRNIWSVFLQLFDDGRLTDRQGRTADFRRCVVILTSNFGAAVEGGRPLGFTVEGGPRFRPAAVERELSRVFSPEFLNRIDRIVVFRPFEREQMRALLERELGQVLDRRGFRGRPWAIEWDEAALEFLAEKGFSAELGARPLKRAVERYLLAPLAAAIVSRSFPTGEQFLFITARDDRIDVTFVDPDAEEVEPAETPPAAALRLERLVLVPGGSPEERAFLQAETERLRGIIDGEGWGGRKERDLVAMRSGTFWESPERLAVLARIEYVDRVQAAFRTAEKLSNRLSRLDRNGGGPARDLVELLAERLYLLDRACAGTDASQPADTFLEIRAAGVDHLEQDFALQLRAMYEGWARRRGMRVQPLRSDRSELLAVSGIGAYRILSAETGLHVFESPTEDGSFDRVAVHVAVAPRLPAPPEGDTVELARLALDELEPSTAIVRRYRAKPSPLVRDAVRDWRTGRLDRVLAGEFDVIVD